MPKQTLEQFTKKWTACKLCRLHKGAHRHVLYRGSIPAEVLLIGEAPGKTENKLGKPFIGRSGDLLSSLLQELGLTSYCITNVVCCIPWKDNKKDSTFRPPTEEEAEACSSHIDELLALTKPKLIVFLGKEAEKHFSLPINFANTSLVATRHPSYILRQGGKTSLEYKRCLYKLHEALTEAGVRHNPISSDAIERPKVVGL